MNIKTIFDLTEFFYKFAIPKAIDCPFPGCKEKFIDSTSYTGYCYKHTLKEIEELENTKTKQPDFKDSFISKDAIPYIEKSGLTISIMSLISPYEVISADDINKCIDGDELAKLLKHADKDLLDKVADNAKLSGISNYAELKRCLCKSKSRIHDAYNEYIITLFSGNINSGIDIIRNYTIDEDKLLQAQDDQELVSIGVPEWYIEYTKPLDAKKCILQEVI